MAGIGVKLTNIYKKNTLTTDIIGAGYSMVVTIAPMLLVIGALMIMEYFLDFSSVDYVTRELFSCTVLYIFIFSLLTASPFNSVLSKYMSDVIYEESYEDILPCYYVGMLLNISLNSILYPGVSGWKSGHYLCFYRLLRIHCPGSCVLFYVVPVYL